MLLSVIKGRRVGGLAVTFRIKLNCIELSLICGVLDIRRMVDSRGEILKNRYSLKDCNQQCSLLSHGYQIATVPKCTAGLSVRMNGHLPPARQACGSSLSPPQRQLNTTVTNAVHVRVQVKRAVSSGLGSVRNAHLIQVSGVFSQA
jgi:hypothetical protein